MKRVNNTVAFSLRGHEGHVRVKYDVNEDPSRWGFDRLGFDWDVSVARGFPLIEARVDYPAEGYAGYLGWIQGVVYTVSRGTEPDEIVSVTPDVAPQLRDANMPYLSFGIEPVLFDAPAFTEPNVDWNARAFLTYTPDLLMSPVVEPLCGFFWGYEVANGIVERKELRGAQLEDWIEVRKDLRVRLPTWKFGGDDWDPPALTQ
jgi:hypothetical protein